MKSYLLLALLAASAARAERTWVFEPEQTLVTAEVLGRSAVSRVLTGRLHELDSGALQLEVRLPVASFEADRCPGAAATELPEIVFEGAAQKPDKDGTLAFKGSVSFRGKSRAVELPVVLVRTGAMIFGHAVLSVHLRDLGLPIPEGEPDEARVTIDTGLRREGTTLASRG